MKYIILASCVMHHTKGAIVDRSEFSEAQIERFTRLKAIQEFNGEVPTPGKDKHDVTGEDVLWSHEELIALRSPQESITLSTPASRRLPVGDLPISLTGSEELETTVPASQTTQTGPTDEELLELSYEAVKKLPYVQLKKYAELIRAAVPQGGRDQLLESIDIKLAEFKAAKKE